MTHKDSGQTLRQVLECLEGAESAAKELERVALSHSSFGWSRFVLAFVEEARTYPQPALVSSRWLVGALNMPFLAPELKVSLLTSSDAKRDALHALAKACSASAVAHLYLLDRGLDDSSCDPEGLSELDPAIRYGLMARRALRSGRLGPAVEGNPIGTALGNDRRIEAESLRAQLLVRAQELEPALDCLVEAYLDRPGFAARFNVKQIIEGVDRRPSPIPHANLARPIGFDIY